MRLLFITPYYKPAWFYGGPPKCISEQAEILANTFKSAHNHTFGRTDPVTESVVKQSVHVISSTVINPNI